MAIIALIVTPLVLNIVRKAKDSANKRSVDAYGKSIDLAVAAYLMEKGDFPTSIDELTIEYSGKEVVCGVAKLNEDSSVYLSECTVGGKEVKDSSNKDGCYHYGTTTTYKEYKIGDIITYNGMNFYVIENSDENSDSVTMLKAEPLTVDEVNTYGIDKNGVSHVNRYTILSVETGTIETSSVYGSVAYYSSETCGYSTPGDMSSFTTAGCTTDYKKSDIKYIVDGWSSHLLNQVDLKEDNLGYTVRLITLEELLFNLGYDGDAKDGCAGIHYFKTDFTPEWVYGLVGGPWYWTMSPSDDSGYKVWDVYAGGWIHGGSDVYHVGYWIDYGNGHYASSGTSVVRPVVTLLKSAL